MEEQKLVEVVTDVEQELPVDEAEEFIHAIKEAVPPENLEELAQKVQELATPKPVTGSFEALKGLFSQPTYVHKGLPTAEHNPQRNRGIGVTRKSKEQSKKSRKIAKNSRRINRGK